MNIRRFSFVGLLTIVALETSALAIDERKSGAGVVYESKVVSVEECKLGRVMGKELARVRVVKLQKFISWETALSVKNIAFPPAIIPETDQAGTKEVEEVFAFAGDEKRAISALDSCKAFAEVLKTTALEGR